MVSVGAKTRNERLLKGLFVADPDAESAAPRASPGRTITFVELGRETEAATAIPQAVHSINQRIFETSLDLILVVDRGGTFVRVSPSSQAILGYRSDEMVGHSAKDFLYPEDLESTREEMRQARRGRLTRHFECRYVHADGRVMTLTWTGVWSEPDQQHFFIGRDITEQRDTERRLRQQWASMAGGLLRRSGWGIKTYLLALVLSSLLPLTVFATYLSYETSQGQLETIKTSIVSTTRALAAAVDEHIRVRQAMLMELARSERLAAGNLAGFHAEMVSLSRLLHGTIITLVRSDGTRALFSSVPPDAVVPGTSQLGLVRRVFETGMPQVSDVFVAAMTHAPIAVIAVPVKNQGAVVYSLNLTLDPADFIRLLTAHDLPSNWLSAIVDRNGRFLARVPDNEKRVGELASEGWRAAINASPDEAWDHFNSLEGGSVYNGHSRAQESGFIVGIGVPASVIEGPFHRSLRDLLIGGCVAVGLGTVIAALVSRRLANGLRQVTAAAEQVPMGRCDAPQTTRVAEIDHITAALIASAQMILERTGQRDEADRVVRQTAEELRLVNGTLEQRVATETADRQRAEAALRQAQKMEAIGQLTGGVAHDFNNLLQVISGNLEALRARVPGEETAQNSQICRYADVAMGAAERGATLTQRLLAFSRQQPLTPEVSDPNALVGGMSDLIRGTIGETISIETVLADDIWRILVDTNQLESAVLNLAVNARDAMPHGGKLTIKTVNAHRDVEDKDWPAGSTAQYVAICVTDTGDGMTLEVMEKVFEPFFTTKPVGQGSGLGLSQVYGFVKQSNGHVTISSWVGTGTTVKIYLPRTHVEAVALRQNLQRISHGGGDTVVLVVEDDPDVRSITVGMLEGLGYRVLEARDGGEALRLFHTAPDIGLMLADVGLPGDYNGRELADKVRRQRPKLKVLLTTGYAYSSIVHDGRLDPGLDLILKPFSSVSLANKISDVLRAE
jgi:PAS domain S-box-containing protein